MFILFGYHARRDVKQLRASFGRRAGRAAFTLDEPFLGEGHLMKTHSTAVIVVVGGIVLGASSGSAMATPPEGDVARTDVAKGSTDAPISIVTPGGSQTTLLVQSLVLKPGASSGWHTHPGPEYSVITDGAVALQTGPGCVVTNYPTGQAVFIPAGVPHRVDNDGTVDASVVVNYTIPADVPVREDSPDVCTR
jgi:quercetin dioxygenase-like cupin family protein